MKTSLLEPTQQVSIIDEPVVPRRRPGQWVLSALLLLATAMVVSTMITNPRFDWPTVWEYLFSPRVLDGVVTTVLLTVWAMGLGLALGVPLAVMRLSENRLISGAAVAYIWFFRGTPLLVQLLFWGFAAALFPTIGIGLPWGPDLITWDTNVLISFAVAAVLGLGLNEAAYVAEIVRAGILSVPEGQSDACAALGFRRFRTLCHVVLPQALRVIIPPVGNNAISMLKTTSLVLVIGVQDLLGSVTQIYAENFKQIPLLIVGSIWYLVLTSVLSVGQSVIERRLGRSRRNAAGRSQR